MEPKKYLFAVCPGHGGSRPGAVEKGVRESDLNLDIALAVAEIRDDVYLTRTEDEWQFYSERSRILSRDQPSVELLISIHNDRAPWAPQVHGLRAYYHMGNGTTRWLAKWVAENAPERLQKGQIICAHDNPEVRHDDWKRNAQYLTEVYRPNVLLIEFGFMSHAADFEFLTSREGVYQCAELIIGAFQQYEWKVKRS